MKDKIKRVFKNYFGLIFRIGLVIIIWNIWENLGRVRTFCPTIYYGEPSPSQIACRTTYNEEVIFRSFFSDSYPLIIFLGIVFILLWFKNKK
tara:strand:- start:311 stop:586 length:276 start_codon:yes stop_codon:yes gene_type:complete